MRTAKRLEMPRYLRQAPAGKSIAEPLAKTSSRIVPVLIRAVTFMPAWQRKRLH